MPWTDAELQAFLDKLDEAIATGAMTVKHGDKAVTYRSVKEMLEARERLQRRLNKAKRKDRGYIACKTGY